jgi:hypothetical protein
MGIRREELHESNAQEIFLFYQKSSPTMPFSRLNDGLRNPAEFSATRIPRLAIDLNLRWGGTAAVLLLRPHLMDPTVSKMICKLPPSQLVECRAGTVKVGRYWDLPKYGKRAAISGEARGGSSHSADQRCATWSFVERGDSSIIALIARAL